MGVFSPVSHLPMVILETPDRILMNSCESFNFDRRAWIICARVLSKALSSSDFRFIRVNFKEKRMILVITYVCYFLADL